jgi:hypothetical protein
MRIRTLVLGGFAVWALFASSIAQVQNENCGLQVKNVAVELRDLSDRPFETATINVNMVQAPGYTNGQTLSCGSVQYTVGDNESKPFTVDEGKANITLLAPPDTQGQPVLYNFNSRGPDGNTYLTESPQTIFATTSRIRLIARYKAPVTHYEKWAAMAFAVIAVALIFATFFLLAFRRMLFHRRMTVASATLWSNIITLLYLLLASCTILLAYLNPSLVTKQAFNTYIGLVLMFLGLYFLGFIFMMLMTQPRAAVRS